MHGRPRVAPKPEDKAAWASKAHKLCAMQSQFLQIHHSKRYDKEALEVSAKLLEINPECYTAWNYRKMAVDYLLGQSVSDSNSIQAILNEELRFGFGSFLCALHAHQLVSKFDGRSSTFYHIDVEGQVDVLKLSCQLKDTLRAGVDC